MGSNDLLGKHCSLLSCSLTCRSGRSRPAETGRHLNSLWHEGGLSSYAVSVRAEAWLGPVAGAATGLITAATGVFVIPAVPYLQALGLGREELVQALGLSFTVSTLALAASLAGAGALGVHSAWGSVLALAPAWAGMLAGQRVRRTVRPELFRRCLSASLLLLGAHLALRGLL